jgi:hypothetical protein
VMPWPMTMSSLTRPGSWISASVRDGLTLTQIVEGSATRH